MKWIVRLLAVASLSLYLTGCAAQATSPVTGFIYMDVKAPVTATSADSGSKTGTAACESILGLIALGDASIEAAMQNGNIKQIHHVDQHSWSILGIWAKYTVTVRGE